MAGADSMANGSGQLGNRGVAQGEAGEDGATGRIGESGEGGIKPGRIDQIHNRTVP